MSQQIEERGGRWRGIPSDRVVAVIAQLDAGRVQIGSGYLISNALVLTARHCTRDAKVGRPAKSLRVVRRTDGSEARAEVLATASDVAVLRLAEESARLLSITSEPPHFGRVDRTHSGELRDCEAMGFPLWQLDPHDQQRNAAELHGRIRVTEDVESGFIVMRDPLLDDVAVPTTAFVEDKAVGSPWGGLSGALVFYKGLALGVVVEHHPRQGGSAIRIIPVDRFAAADTGDPGMAAVAAALRLPPLNQLPLLSGSQFHAKAWLSRESQLTAYLEAARAAARQLPYASAFRDAPQLTAVYLRQQISPQAPRGHARQIAKAEERPLPVQKGDVAAMYRRIGLEEATQLIQKADPWEAIRRYPLLLIMGGPGMGKSSLLRHLVDNLTTAWLAEGGSESFVPVLVQAVALTKAQPFQDAVAQAVTSQLGTLLPSFISLNTLLADQPFPNVPWLILSDGTDEVLNADERLQVFSTVVHWGRDARYRFLLTSRMLPKNEFRRALDDGVEIFEIQPLTEEESILLSQRWFTGLGIREPEKLVDRYIIQLRDGRIGQLARNPLIATAICVALADDPALEEPLSRPDLYERFVRALIEKPFKQFNARERLQAQLRPYSDAPEQVVGKVLDDLRPLIEFLAESRLFDAVHRLLVEYAEKFPSCSIPSSLRDQQGFWRGVLSDVLRQVGCLVQQGNSDFDFIHQTVMEYLAACNLRYSARFRRRQGLALAVRASQDDSYALFAVAILRRAGIDVTRHVPRFLGVGRLIHARLVALLARDGIIPERRAKELAERRLWRAAMQSRQSLLNRLSDIAWGGEDGRVVAAKSLALLDPDKGYAALAQASVKPDSGSFNIYTLLTQDTIRAPGTATEQERAINVLMDLAFRPAQDEFCRVLAAKVIFALEPQRGTSVMEALIRDPSLDSAYRMQCISLLMEADYERGIEALASFSANPGTDLRLRFQAIDRLEQMRHARAHEVLEEIALNSANNGFARTVASMGLRRVDPSVGKRAILTLVADKEAAEFHRVVSSFFLTESDSIANLTELAIESSLSGEWRIFAASLLADSDLKKGIVAMQHIARSSDIRWRLRLQAMLNAWAYRVSDRLNKEIQKRLGRKT